MANEIIDYGWGQIIWNQLYGFYPNAYGIAGLMGNLYAESALVPYRKQGDYGGMPFEQSQLYTTQVNSGIISQDTFVHDSIGYGLAQWTYFSRKQGLYNMKNQGGYSSIGDVYLGCEFLHQELETGYRDTRAVIIAATSIKEASDYVLHNFENPKEQGPEVEQLRYEYSQSCYEKFSGQGPVPPPPPPPTPTGKFSLPMAIAILAKAAQR